MVVNITNALNPITNKSICINDAERLIHFYKCLKCKENMVVVKGKKTKYHFRHEKNSKCDGKIKTEPKTELPELKDPDINEENINCVKCVETEKYDKDTDVISFKVDDGKIQYQIYIKPSGKFYKF
tara:strand:- start:1393 stop:1770 length:378 start_codon:yes stop_codon:yes gene_type:complete